MPLDLEKECGTLNIQRKKKLNNYVFQDAFFILDF